MHLSRNPRASAQPAACAFLAAALVGALAATLAPPARTALAQEELGITVGLRAKAGGGPVYEVLRGASVFFDNVPEAVRAREKCEQESLSSDEVAKVTGAFKLDLDAPDFTGMSAPKPPEVSCSFTRKDGGEWRLFPMRDSVWKRGHIRSSNAKQIFAFGPTNLGTPLEPKQRTVFRLKGKCRLEKDGKNLTLEAPFELVVGGKTRDRETGKYMGGYEVQHEGLEVKVLIPETFEVPGHGRGLSIVYTSALCEE